MADLVVQDEAVVDLVAHDGPPKVRAVVSD